MVKTNERCGAIKLWWRFPTGKNLPVGNRRQVEGSLGPRDTYFFSNRFKTALVIVNTPVRMEGSGIG